MQTKRLFKRFLPFLIVLIALGCSGLDRSRPDATQTATLVTSERLPTTTPTPSPSATAPPPSPTGSQELLLDETPEAVLINSLYCPGDNEPRAYIETTSSSQVYGFWCEVRMTQWDVAFTGLRIKRYPSRAEAEAAFYMAYGTLGEDQGFVVISNTRVDTFDWNWHYLGEQHVVSLYEHSPYPHNSIGASMYTADIGFRSRLESFAETLNFVRSPIDTPMPPPIAEREALVALYQATGGQNWDLDSGWLLSDHPVCSWYGVTCSNGHVVRIDLSWNNLQGKLPPEIVQLTGLQYLLLSFNQLTELPPEIDQLSSLQGLSLADNQLTELPPEIVQLSSLQGLSLADNQLTELPPEIVQLSSLQGLSLADNQLTELPPEIVQLTGLRELSLADNQLTELPPDFGQLTDLQRLYLGSNQLTELPPEFGQLTDLQHLDLESNQLIELPPDFGQLTDLQRLNLHHNQLTELPPDFGQLTNLQVLDLGFNELTKLPSDFGQLTNLQRLYLESNRLIELPPDFDQLSNLQVLDLSFNEFTKLSPEICHMSGLYLSYLREELCGK